MISQTEPLLAESNRSERLIKKNPFLAAQPVRVALLCDIVEENWPSMDLVGEMIFQHLERDHAGEFIATRLAPRLRRRLTRLRPTSNLCFNADRVVNRFWDYQRWLQPQKKDFDLFHVIDHSYGQLLHYLPPDRTIITCHDLDTFRCLLAPETEPRSRWFRQMMSNVLHGFQKAAIVACDSKATHDELLAHQLIAPERLRIVPLGVHPSCTTAPDPAADAEARRLLEGPANAINLLHVGSTIKRKRIDVLLRTLAGLRAEFPEVRLIRAGGAFTSEQMDLIRRLELNEAIVVLPFINRSVLAAVYRQAALVLQPSEGEGFGLPVLEAQACGTPVLASDIPTLREVGAAACTYATVGDFRRWSAAASELLNERSKHPERWQQRRAAGIENATRFSWSACADQMAVLYRELSG